MSPELVNLGISFLLFGLIAWLWRSCFAAGSYGGRGAPVFGGGGVDKPKNLVEVRSEADFFRFVRGEPLSVVDWTATWCGPCQMIAPHFLELARTNPEINFLKVDLDQQRGLATQHGIKSVPTFCFFKRGVEVDRMSGNDPTGLTERVKKHK